MPNYSQDEQRELLLSYMEANSDTKTIHLESKHPLTLYFISSLIDPNYVTQSLEIPYFNATETFERYFYSISTRLHDDTPVPDLCTGSIIAFYRGKFWSIPDGKQRKGRSVSLPEVESVYIGPQEAFVEDIQTNLNLIRNRYRHHSLRVQEYTLGTKSNLKVNILYNEDLTDSDMLRKITERLHNVSPEIIQSSNNLSSLFHEGHTLLFPRAVITERPDRTCRALTQGKIVLLLEGTPFASIIPVNLHEFLKAADDEYLFTLPKLFTLSLRYFALFIGITLPGAYVAFTAYNPEVFRVQLALSIAGSREGVPYPSFIEVLFMLVMMELLVEASLRLPRTIGPAATTVGGLILGQAATQANLVSDIMIIVVSAVAISNFAIPVSTLSISARVVKYFILFFASVGGFFGLFLGITLFSLYAFSLQHLDHPLSHPRKWFKGSMRWLLEREDGQ